MTAANCVFVVAALLRAPGCRASAPASRYGLVKRNSCAQRIQNGQLSLQAVQHARANHASRNVHASPEAEALFYAGQPVYGGAPAATGMRLRSEHLLLLVFSGQEDERPDGRSPLGMSAVGAIALAVPRANSFLYDQLFFI